MANTRASQHDAVGERGDSLHDIAARLVNWKLHESFEGEASTPTVQKDDRHRRESHI
jgi:hypothetical protein